MLRIVENYTVLRVYSPTIGEIGGVGHLGERELTVLSRNNSVETHDLSAFNP